MERLSDTNWGGCTSYVDRDGDQSKIIHTFEDNGAFCDYTAAHRSHSKWGGYEKNFMRKVASVPAAIQYEWLTKYGVNVYNSEHADRVTKLLNSNDYRYLKTAEVII